MESYLDKFKVTEDHDYVIYCEDRNSFLCNNKHCPDLIGEEMMNFYKDGLEVAHFSVLNRNLSDGFTKSVIVYPNGSVAKQALINLYPRLSRFFPECKNWRVRRIRTKLFLDE